MPIDDGEGSDDLDDERDWREIFFDGQDMKTVFSAVEKDVPPI
jgi:hypothetical protein